MSRRLYAGALAAALGVAGAAHAHKPSDSYLTLRVEPHGASGHWDIALRDLDRALTLDRDGAGQLTWGELRTRERELVAYAFDRLQLSRAGTACALEPEPLGLVEHSDGRYARLAFHAGCDGADGVLALRYGFFFELDPQHRAVVRTTVASPHAQPERTHVLSAERRVLSLAGPSAPEAGALALVASGIGHILAGLDHVLFLLALLLPSVLGARPHEPPGARLRALVRDVVKVVTAFTLAHSLTLALAALGLVSLSARVIEPAIAASVALAAIDNVRPLFGGERWSVAFVLGLLHGFGFSSALGDLGLRGADLLLPLLAFNTGVELGQLAIVALTVPLALLGRGEWAYRFAFVRGGSVAIAAVSLLWLVERIGEG